MVDERFLSEAEGLMHHKQSGALTWFLAMFIGYDVRYS
jgi:hypothetical protein